MYSKCGTKRGNEQFSGGFLVTGVRLHAQKDISHVYICITPCINNLLASLLICKCQKAFSYRLMNTFCYLSALPRAILRDAQR